MHIHSSAGLLRAGRYGELELTGSHELESGVQFNTCTLAGSAVMRGCTGVTLILRSARVLCQGDMHIDSLRGYGQIEITGSLRCRIIDFTGKIFVRDALVCDQSLDATGVLTGQGLINANSMHVAGAILANDVRSMRMSVVHISNAMYVNKLTDEYRTRSLLARIMSHQVTLEDVSCRHLQAAYVTLRRCDVEYLAYSRSFTLDPQSRVSRTVLTTTRQTGHYRRRA